MKQEAAYKNCRNSPDLDPKNEIWHIYDYPYYTLKSFDEV